MTRSRPLGAAIWRRGRACCSAGSRSTPACSPGFFLLPGPGAATSASTPLRCYPLGLRDTRPRSPRAGIGGLGGHGAGQKARIGSMRGDEQKGARPRPAIGEASGKGRCRDAERSRETDLVRISEAASRLGIGQERTWGRGYGCKEGRSLRIDRTCKRKRS